MSGHARMVDVGTKEITERTAVARGFVVMQPETVAAIRDGSTAKGDVRAAARSAGILAAKRTAELIPLCHPLPLNAVWIELAPQPEGIAIEAAVRSTGRTGVEMEALTAVTIAALTVYDMCKAIDRGMRIEAVCVVLKDGGKSGRFAQT